MRRLELWWKESPLDAIAVVPFDSGYASPTPTHAPRPNPTEDYESWFHEPMEPPVGALLAGMRIGPDGRAYIVNYADRLKTICGLDPFAHENTFLQLATLARGYAVQRDRLGLAQSLARLARVGLEPVARRAPRKS
ncbi:MAG: hypothetical protein ACM3NW_11715 [Syntrophomonadaceae bacterium]